MPWHSQAFAPYPINGLGVSIVPIGPPITPAARMLIDNVKVLHGAHDRTGRCVLPPQQRAACATGSPNLGVVGALKASLEYALERPASRSRCDCGHACDSHVTAHTQVPIDLEGVVAVGFWPNNGRYPHVLLAVISSYD